MNLIAEEYERRIGPIVDIMVGYFSGACKERHPEGCMLCLNFENPKADVKECIEKNIRTEEIYIDDRTIGLDKLLHEPDLKIGDIIIAVFEETFGPNLPCAANEIMKLDKATISMVLRQLKDLDPKLVEIPEHKDPCKLECGSGEEVLFD